MIPHGKVTNRQLDITNESPDVSPFPAGDHMAPIHRRARKHNKNKTEITQMIHKRSTALERSVKILNWKAFDQFHCANLALNSHVDQDTLTHLSYKMIVPLYI